MPHPMGLDGHLSNARFRNSDPPSSESVFAYFREPPRPTATRMPSNSSNNALNDARSSLHRRFTTNALASPPGQQRSLLMEPSHIPELSFAMNQKIPPSEKKKAEYEYLKQKQLQRQSQMDILNSEIKREELELHRLSSELGMSNGIGHQSEPTTPPEYRENGFPTILSRPNRFSASNLIASPGSYKRMSRGDSQITSPPSERARAYDALTSGSPSQSNPQTRDHSDEETDPNQAAFSQSHRSAASLNRNSMPVTRRDLGGHKAFTQSTTGLGSVDTTSFLFRDDNSRANDVETPNPSRHSVSFLQANETEDQFPVLLRRDRIASNRYSGSALDILSGQDRDLKTIPGGWSGPTRLSQPGLTMSTTKNSSKSDSPPLFKSPQSSGDVTPMVQSSNNRHSLGSYIGQTNEAVRPAKSATSSDSSVPGNSSGSIPKLQASLSTNDIPTMKNVSTIANGVSQQPTLTASTADQSFHNHNVSLGRIPPSAGNSNRQSREFSPVDSQKDERKSSVQSLQSAIQLNAQSSAPNVNGGGEISVANNFSGSSTAASPYQNYWGYGMGALNSAVANMNMSNPTQWNASLQMFPQGFTAYSPHASYAGSRSSDSQTRVGQQRRNQNGDESSRFANVALENLQGEIYGLCKDQHGCRYLQKKLEENKPEQTEMIFNETKDKMCELMVDPFGNYLCQKLLEYTDTDQHTLLIKNAGPEMVPIALNQHGTRALQKMIEYVSNEEQVETVIEALRDQVVAMIQDLNGNHVIQKCLNRLTAENAQFIFDAVATNVVAVGTHRHGCCVIQRCIDHAIDSQKNQLIDAITRCSFPLVQDPFGNYVLQYIFDQGEDTFSQLLCRTFLGNIAVLSKQKFSSNVIEKCIRIADDETKHLMIEEMLDPVEFERLVDDAFANYVVQTAWDHANPEDEALIAERIRPLLLRMRNKPYGRRFQSRIGERDKRLGMSVNGSMTPTDISSPDSMILGSPNSMAAYHRQLPAQSTNGFQSPAGSSYGGASLNGFASPTYTMTPGPEFGSPPQRYHNAHTYHNLGSFQNLGQLQQPFSAFVRPEDRQGMNFY